MKLLHKFTFDSWGEYLAIALDQKIPRFGRTAKRHLDGDREWFGGVTWKQAEELGVGGWEEGANKAHRISGPIFERLSSMIQREDIVFDIEGIEIDIARYIDGEPECWNRIERVIEKGQGQKVIKVVFNIAASFGVSAEVMTRKGAAVFSLIELLEYAGHRVELWVMMAGDNKSGGKIEMWSLVKMASDNLDRGRLAFALAHPAMFRRLGFSVLATMPQEIQDACNGGFGNVRPCECDQADRGDVYIGSSEHSGGFSWTDPDSAEKFVISELKNQGIELEVKEVAI